jgi:anti-anti-sigma factor
VVGDRVDFAVELERLDDHAVVHVDGEFDLSGFEQFEEVLADAARSGHVVVDLGDCTFLDSAGVRAIAAAIRDAERVSIVASDPAIVRVLEITALDSVVAVHPSLDDVR